MVQKTYSIYHSTNASLRLFVEVGQQQVACWTMEDTTNIIHNFELFEFETPNNINEFESIFHEIKITSRLLEGSHIAAHIVWENDQCVVVPDQYFDSGNCSAYLNMLLGEYDHSLVQQKEQGNMHFLYRVDERKNKILHNVLPLASSIHKYQTLFNTANTKNIFDDYIRLSFYRKHFVLTVVKEGILQLVQSFAYDTPEDVLYHVMNACKQYGLYVQSIKVLVSGLIDIEGLVYEDLQQYLNNLQIEEIKQEYLAPPFSQYPSYHFSTFFKMLV